MKPNQDKRDKLDQKWNKINNSIKQSNPGYEAPNVPFKSSKLVADFNPLYKKIYDKEKFINE